MMQMKVMSFEKEKMEADLAAAEHAKMLAEKQYELAHEDLMLFLPRLCEYGGDHSIRNRVRNCHASALLRKRWQQKRQASERETLQEENDSVKHSDLMSVRGRDSLDSRVISEEVSRGQRHSHGPSDRAESPERDRLPSRVSANPTFDLLADAEELVHSTGLASKWEMLATNLEDKVAQLREVRQQ